MEVRLSVLAHEELEALAAGRSVRSIARQADERANGACTALGVRLRSVELARADDLVVGGTKDKVPVAVRRLRDVELALVVAVRDHGRDAVLGGRELRVALRAEHVLAVRGRHAEVVAAIEALKGLEVRAARDEVGRRLLGGGIVSLVGGGRASDDGRGETRETNDGGKRADVTEHDLRAPSFLSAIRRRRDTRIFGA